MLDVITNAIVIALESINGPAKQAPIKACRLHWEDERNPSLSDVI